MGRVQALQSPRDDGAGVGRGRVWEGARAGGSRGSRGSERERERSGSRGREAARSDSRGREAARAGSRERD